MREKVFSARKVYLDYLPLLITAVMIILFAISYLMMVLVAMFIDAHAINLLVTSPLLFIGANEVFNEEMYETFIAEKSKCAAWKNYVCKNCNTLIPGKAFVGRDNYGSTSTQYRDTTTTTTTTTDATTIGNTTYVDTTVRTDVQVDDYILTKHSYGDKYRCPKCNRIHTLSGSYTTRTNL